MRCNLFKTIGAGDERMGTFLTFSQYTEDLTKEQVMKSNYRVVPSKFVAINLNIDNVIKAEHDISTSITDNNMQVGDMMVEGINNIIPQLFQSYFENSNAWIRNMIDSENRPSNFPEVWDVADRSIASELLWRTLQDCGFINKPVEDEVGFPYYDEIKYIGDINIHSNHTVGSYSYDEVFCHIPAKADEYYYPLICPTIESFIVKESDGEILNMPLEEWSDTVYPNNSSLVNRAITYHEDSNNDVPYTYRIGGYMPVLDITQIDTQPVPRHDGSEENTEYKFNAVILFYDIICNEPGEDPYYVHRFRPMGIYLSGPADDSGDTIVLKNTFTKYITNNDAYGQGASFGLRILSRYTPTPNMTTQVMEVDENSDDYETMTQAMGSIADAVIDINRLCKDQKAMYQTFKDHLAQFRNRRVNIPYVRTVNGDPYWFINGRNTGQRVYPEPEPQQEITESELEDSMTIEGEGNINLIDSPEDVVDNVIIEGEGTVEIYNE